MQNTFRVSRLFVFIAVLVSLLAFVSAPAMQGDAVSAAPLLRRAPGVDLTLVMSVDKPTPNKNEDIVFTLTVTNIGDDPATNVAVTDNLPAGLTWQSDDGGGAYVGGVWTIGPLASGASAVLHITAKNVTKDPKTNSANATSLEPDTNPGNNPASQLITPKIIDLSLATISSSPSLPLLGDDVTFTIKVTNNGAAVATGVTVKVVLTPDLTYVSDDGGGTYNSATGTWVVGALTSAPAAGSSATIKIKANIPTTGAKIITAEVWTADQFDNDSTPANSSEDDYATKTVTVDQADLEITNTVSSTTPPTKYVQFTISVINHGPNDATGVTVKDVLPAGVEYISDNLGTYNSVSGIWAIGFLGNGATTTLIINARISTPGAKTNIAEVWTSDQHDGNSTPGNGVTSEDDYEASLPTTPLVSDLSLTKTVDTINPTPGNPVEFTITVTNNGPDNATNVTIQDVLPSDLTYVSNDGGAIHNSGTVTWNVGALASSGAGSSATLHIIATSSVSPIGTNLAEVWTSDQVDPDSTPGFDEVVPNEDDDDGTPYADLSIEKTVNNPTPKLGENIIFTVTVRNAGPLDATGLIVKDLLDTNFFTFVSSVQSGGSGGTPYDKNLGLWGVGTLTSGANATLSITVTVKQTGALTNRAEVWDVNQFDPDSTPGLGTPLIVGQDDDKTVTVTPSAGMAVVISEVAWAGTSASSTAEWLELYNPGTVEIDITGWKLKDGSGEVLLSGKIAPGAFFILADNSGVFSAGSEPVTVNQIDSGLGLTNDGEILQLVDLLGNVIDTANKDGGSWPAGDSDVFASMERIVTEVDGDTAWYTNQGVERYGYDANNNPIWGTPGKANSTPPAATATPTATATATPITQTPTRTLTPTKTVTPTRTVTRTPTAEPVGRPVINEFLARPGYDWNRDGFVDVYDEFIEIKNIGIVEINLKGWKLDDEADSGSTPFTFPDLLLLPGDRVVFYGNETRILLSDGGDTVRLLNASNKVYDAYTYPLAKFKDKSVCRMPDGNGSWYEDCIPTPNLTNSRQGSVPSMPGGSNAESELCDFPDTMPEDFVYAECRGFGGNIWDTFFWDQFGWLGRMIFQPASSKWEIIVE
ncbi:MAG TPA: lamin tail domain-containing protein [Anaerolineales bacterium]|nr:lamin tail domain-containing protein [Anaerolineales bacterium]